MSTIFIYAITVLFISVAILLTFHFFMRNKRTSYSVEALLHSNKVNTFILLYIALWLIIASDHVDIGVFGFRYHGLFYVCCLGLLIGIADLIYKYINKNK